jgi:superfamily II DNA or RNA helicase
MSKYLDIDDENFYKSINKIYSRYKIPKEKKTLRQICFPTKYEFQIPQKFLAEFINPKTPYKGILVYHRIGAGKTCTAINIAEKFKHTKNIMVVLPASLKGNFRSELRSLCAGQNY